jgi:hypothetical protein
MLPPNAADSGTGAVPELQCKGSHALQIRNWVDQRRGPGAFQHLMSTGRGKNLGWQQLLVGSWYDAEALLDVIEAAAKEEQMKVEDAVEEIARMNAREDLKTVYRVFLRILSPTRVVGFLPRMWQQYFRFGGVEILQNRTGYVELRTHGIPPRFVPWVIGGWRGFLAETLLAAGGKRPVVSGIRIASQGSSWSVRVEATYD